jgi:hypothetical protein
MGQAESAEAQPQTTTTTTAVVSNSSSSDSTSLESVIAGSFSFYVFLLFFHVSFSCTPAVCINV